MVTCVAVFNSYRLLNLILNMAPVLIWPPRALLSAYFLDLEYNEAPAVKIVVSKPKDSRFESYHISICKDRKSETVRDLLKRSNRRCNVNVKG